MSSGTSARIPDFSEVELFAGGGPAPAGRDRWAQAVREATGKDPEDRV